jgi:multiple sugar transport system substrate-binding protein
MLDQPEAIEALQWQADLIFKHRVCPISGAGAVGGIELFTAGKLAMTYHGSWTVRQVAATKDLDWDVAVLPKGRQRAVVTNGLAECVWSGTDEPELCWEFVKYLTSDACQRRLPVIASRKTATRSWLQSNVYEREADGETREVMIPESGHVFIDMLDYARARPITPDLLEWTDALSKYTQALLQAGEMDAEEAMRRAAEEVDPILQRGR